MFKIKALILFSILLFSSKAFSLTYSVQADGNGDYPNIQSAIVASVDGDTIELHDGIFTGAGNYEISFMGKGIVLKSQSGNPDDCIIDVAGTFDGVNQHGFHLNSRETLLSEINGITIKNGNADGD